MSVAVQAVLEGMPDPRDLRCITHDGHTVITVGNQMVAAYRASDTGMRNIAVVTLTDLGFPGRRGAERETSARVWAGGVGGAIDGEGGAGGVCGGGGQGVGAARRGRRA